MSERYIGLMSGTSADGIDAVLVDFIPSHPSVVATHYTPYTGSLREKILALCEKGDDEIKRMGMLDRLLGEAFAEAINSLLKKQSIDSASIKAIGSHGQTIRHHPDHPHRFTIQIGDPNTIAALTGITTVADFRRKDLAHGGQGAPLVPAFHQYVLASDQSNRAIVNIGGIANVTLLPKDNAVSLIGFDTGPGNVLMDAWIYAQQGKSHDAHGEWAATGTLDPDLLTQFLLDDYFQLPPPKSTGREHFHLDWLQKQLTIHAKKISSVNVQATLAELTASSIINAIKKYLSEGEILVCGGGVHNDFLMTRMQASAQPAFTVASTQKYNMDPDWIEAMAFAWLARQTLHHQPGNVPSVTGAKRSTILGGIYYGT